MAPVGEEPNPKAITLGPTWPVFFVVVEMGKWMVFVKVGKTVHSVVFRAWGQQVMCFTARFLIQKPDVKGILRSLAKMSE